LSADRGSWPRSISAAQHNGRYDVYQRAGLTQSASPTTPDFTKGGDFMWSNSTTQADDAPRWRITQLKNLGLKKLAVLNLNTGLGQATLRPVLARAKAKRCRVVANEVCGWMRNFRAVLTNRQERQPGWRGN